MPTIKDIAKAAGVSHSTVSNVLNNKPGVSSEKIRLVQETAKAMGYRIDEQASLLRKGVTRTVAVILPDIRSTRYCDLYVGILQSLEGRGYSARLYLTDDIPYQEKQAIDSAIAAKACAILTATCLEYAERRYSLPSLAHTPVLFLDRCPQTATIPCFHFDYRQAGQALAQEALKMGFSLPAVFTGDLHTGTNQDFLDGVKSVFANLAEKQQWEMKYGESIINAYTAFHREIAFDCCITESCELADQLWNSYQAVGAGDAPAFFTLSSLRTSQDRRFSLLPLNYSRLGADGASALLDAVEGKTELSSQLFDASCFCPKFPKVLLKGSRPLRILSLASPSSKALDCLLPEFTRQTGIAVEQETHPLHEIYNHIRSGIQLDCDVLRLDVSSLAFLAPGLLTPLTELDSQAEARLANFIPGLEKNYSYVDNRLYAFPFDVSIQMLFYRRDLFEDAMQVRSFFEQNKRRLRVPETFEEYNETARFFTRNFRTDSPTAYGSSIALGNASSTASEYLVRLLGMGGDIYDENGLLRISTSKARRALKSYLETALYADPEAIRSWGAASDNFVRGETAMTILFANHASGLIRARSALAASQVGFAPVPGSRPLLGGGSLGVYFGSDRKEDAYRLICWITGDETAARLMMMGGISPCRSAYEQIEILKTYPWLKDFEKNLSLGNRRLILSNQEMHLDLHSFETALGQLIIDAAQKRRPQNETIWRAQQLIDQIGGQAGLTNYEGGSL